jgi:hypothetical protein
MTNVSRRTAQPKPSENAKRQFQRRFRTLPETTPETAYPRATETIRNRNETAAKPSRNYFANPAETVRNRPYRGADCRAVRPVRLTSPGPADGLRNRSGMGIQSRHHHAERDLDGYFSPPEATDALLAIEHGRLPQHLWKRHRRRRENGSEREGMQCQAHRETQVAATRRPA